MPPRKPKQQDSEIARLADEVADLRQEMNDRFAALEVAVGKLQVKTGLLWGAAGGLAAAVLSWIIGR